ncbi:hypothetical protein AX14_000607 [Amanita brunnescens Koide BX004]|nr:hypothetical protein AX14_000607 [Amanita brunnescens Koide BX004]
MPALYRIESVQTGYVVVSTKHDKQDDRVVIEPSSAHQPAVVTIDPPVEAPGMVKATVKGASGLYIAVRHETTGSHLIWTKEAHSWEFATNGPPGTHSIFVPGQDLYWFDKGVHRHLIVEPGRNAQQHEIFFRLVRIDRVE